MKPVPDRVVMQNKITFSLFSFPLNTFGASSSIDLKQVQIDLSNKASLQASAKIYVNNCLGCHTLKYQRYVKLTIILIWISLLLRI